MSDRPRTLFLLLLACLLCASQALGQSPPRRLSMSERLSAIGRSLTGGEEESQPASQTAAQGTSDQRTAFPQVNGQQLLPTTRFGSRTSPQAGGTAAATTRHAAGQNAPAAGTQSPATTLEQPARQPATAGLRGNSAPRTAIRTNTTPSTDGESVQDQYRLPGLGGSPLPSSVIAGPSGMDAAEQENASDSTPPRQPAFPTAASAGASAGSSTTPVRSSPQRRTPTQVDAGELRHDLSGAYPAGNATDGAATSQNRFSTTDPAPIQTETQRSNGNRQSNENIFTLPTNDSAGEAPIAPAVTPIEDSATLNTLPQSQPAAAPTNSGNSMPGFDTSPSRNRETQSPRAQSTENAATNTLLNVPATTTIVPIQPAPHASGDRLMNGEQQTVRGNAANILVSNQAPIISTDIRGPKQIVVGREAMFHVRVHNQGNAAAEGIELTVRIPSWANVIDSNPTTGTVAQAPMTDAAGTLKWQLARLGAGSSEALDLKLVPRSSRPLELGVNWTVSPVGSRAIVEVQEPKLELNVAGPDEVLFGKPQLYRFTLSNPGTGTAENVRIDLFPPGGGEKAAASNTVGNLAPGKSQTIEVELVARDPGKLTIKAIAAADGELNSTATKDVFCRKPELVIDWRGPDVKYAGTEATYHVRVRNPGTAPAEDVTVRATLPDGAQLTSASEGQNYDPTRREIAWRVGSLGPGDDYYMELKCTVASPGKNQLRLTAANSAGDLTDSKLVETNVIALADLKLEVSDPSGPVAVGANAIYEIRVQNRGASTAHDIQVVGMFSAGVDPVAVDGAQYSVSDGRVAFRSIDELAPGKQVVLKIRAQAGQPGMHVFRAEVLCRDLEIKLAAEETTRFFADESISSGTSNQQADSTNAFDAPVR